MDTREDRERLVDVGLEVCARHGYEKTTLADIAAAAGVLQNVLAAEFATTEAIVMATVDDMLRAVRIALADIGPEVGSIDALKAAHAKVLSDISDGVGPTSRKRMQAMGTVVMNSPDLQQRTSAHRREVLGAVLAERLGVGRDDPTVASAVTTWSAVVAATYVAAPDKRGRFDPLDDARRPDRMRDRLTRAFRVITGR